MKRRREYLATLLKYCTAKNIKIAQMLSVYRGFKANLEREQDDDLYLSLHSSQMFEKLDPMHRTLGMQKTSTRYDKWLRDQIARSEDPAENLVDFFISIDREAAQFETHTGRIRLLQADICRWHCHGLLR